MHICCEAWFGHVFRTNARLAHVTIASGKKSFERCTTVGNLETAIKAARRDGDRQKVMDKKAEHLAHYLLEKADKVNYYATCIKARTAGSSIASCIIDKMDGNKNKCPRCRPLFSLRSS
eukprot:4264022-Pleurochrysis_carterae.AAC.2